MIPEPLPIFQTYPLLGEVLGMLIGVWLMYTMIKE
jgi:hypothetical protein|tara:strand:- start:381 stop:485 length:105 start_codon:yes stop_codon:yes gene_type:complete